MSLSQVGDLKKLGQNPMTKAPFRPGIKMHLFSLLIYCSAVCSTETDCNNIKSGITSLSLQLFLVFSFFPYFEKQAGDHTVAQVPCELCQVMPVGREPHSYRLNVHTTSVRIGTGSVK